MNKAEKLAAARKKLKEFQNQQRNKENHENSPAEQPRMPRNDIDSPSFKQGVSTIFSAEDAAKSSVQNFPASAPSNASNPFATQQPSLANYFQSSNRNEFFFDNVQKDVNGDTNHDSVLQRQTDSPNTFMSEPPARPPTTSFFSPTFDDNAPTTSFAPFYAATDVSNQNTNGNGNQTYNAHDHELNALKLELQQARSEIKMQRNALDILTAEKEDLQNKLTNAVQEADFFERNARSLGSQLEESSKYQKKLEVTIEDLQRNKENVSSRELEFEQILSDMKEKNDELSQSLAVEKENNRMLQSQLDETRSDYGLLTLKFQQLGIEVDNDHSKDYKSVHEECELWKRKYDELENRLKAVLYEKERTEEEYRQYVVNLKAELDNVNAELRRFSDENQMLAERISSQTEHISSLERQLQRTPGEASKDATIVELLEEVQKLRIKNEEDVQSNERLTAQLTENEALKRTIYELESQIENLKADMTNAQELQMAVESNKVAASQAIAQNAKLKNEFEQLHQMVQILNEEKVMLTKMLEDEKNKNAEVMVVSQNGNESDTHEITTNDAAINTDAEGPGGENDAYGKANVEAMLLLQEKFKSVLDRMADLTDEKQQLEHLVMQLQSETETIEEYVALYQKQRSVLQQRARETDLKMENVSQEKERLLNILRLILTTDNFDSAFVKQLVENNLSVELSEELASTRGSAAVDRYYNGPILPKNDNSHHPSCSCCSGQLITI